LNTSLEKRGTKIGANIRLCHEGASALQDSRAVGSGPACAPFPSVAVGHSLPSQPE